MTNADSPSELGTLFHGPNAGYVIELYERYRDDPQSVDESTRRLFAQWTPSLTAGPPPAESPSALDYRGAMGVVNLAQAIREYGHLEASLDPLGREAPGDPTLSPEYYGLSEADLRELPASLVGGPCGERCGNALEALEELRQIYSTTIGYDYDHLRVPEERQWLRDAAEEGWFRPPQMEINSEALLERLTQVEVFEHFLQRTFPGKTRFSIEGLDTLVPILDEIVGAAVEQRIEAVLLGMAHRGRLNVLAHVLNKPYTEMLAEFKDPVASNTLNERDLLGYTGDVKYHAGANRCVSAEDAEADSAEVDITMTPNPSHLEHVNPVVEGMARAAGTLVEQAGPPEFNHIVSLPLLIHGDAAFPGQGIVSETLNLSRLEGYRTGGTIHIIANNQLGFTTEPEQTRSTLYASDLAKGFKIPIVHVNADDPIACIEAARLAAAYRQRFQRDFLIDLIGYRRYGHNEGDEPRFTQPRLYELVEEHPTVRQLWASRLIDEGILDEERPQTIYEGQMDELQTIYEDLVAEEALSEPQLTPPPPGAAGSVDTRVELDRLRAYFGALRSLPEGFTLHRRLERIFGRQQESLDARDGANIDWSTAEQLALASILADGTPIRMTGEDIERGTFSQRHAVLWDAESGERHIPLQTLPEARASFEIHNSPLSEAATIGFEYGYNIQAPERLVIWEAQYGDFINVAQAVIDEFVVSGRAKWEETPSLVLLLPHGYEGAGPDHSTGRLERFLQLAAETNIRIAFPTTSAQYFHLLRRQALLLEKDPLPLIVMSPKSLLRNKLAASTPEELSDGRWNQILTNRRGEPAGIKRLILSSGKVALDLLSYEGWEEQDHLALVRLEQLYPLPLTEIEAVLGNYPNLEQVAYLQEEPENMGAWEYVQPRLLKLLDGRWPLYYLGRPRRSSPAEGSSAWHGVNQRALLERALAQEMPSGSERKGVSLAEERAPLSSERT